MENKKIIVLLGRPGCGKGTQGSKLSEKYDIPVISVGDLFRYEIKNETPIGKEVSALVSAGKLVSEDYVFKMVHNRIQKDDCKKGYILDGLPRNEKQFNMLQNDNLIGKPDFIIYFNISKEIVLERVKKRYTCADCGEPLIVENPENAKCTKCGSKNLYQRKDDKEEVAKARQKEYEENTAIVVDLYKENYENNFVEINVKKEYYPSDVYEIICNELKKKEEMKIEY